MLNKNINLIRGEIMSKIINYAGEDFDNEIVLQNGLTLVDFLPSGADLAKCWKGSGGSG